MEKLQYYRKKAGYTQKQLADKVGVSRSSVAMWESGTDCGLETAAALARILSVPLNELLGVETVTNDVTDDSTDAVTDDELMQMREDMRRNPELRTLFSLTKGATKQEMRQLEGIVRALRGSNDHEEDTDGA